MYNTKEIESAILAIAGTVEKQIDEEIEALSNMPSNEIKELRKKRLEALSKAHEQKIIWMKNGHGQYERLAEEKHFFDTIKQSENVVCHFYQDNSERCKIVDMHLKILAPLHYETRFIALAAPKCPFLAEKLKISVLPTLVLIKHQKIVDRIVGFTDLGNRDDFTTKILEWRIACSNVIDYEGDIRQIPDEKEKKSTFTERKFKNKIRETESDTSDDEDFD